MPDLEPRIDMPCVRYGGVAYPVLFSVSAIKRWSEHKEQTFAEALCGWSIDDLSDVDIRTMLRLALEAGEHRRRLFATGENQTITDDLLGALLDTYHPLELLKLMTEAWNQIPGGEPDPQRQKDPSPGEV